MSEHEGYMRRCLELAGKGLGYTRTNPLVGCVVVYDGKIIGEGYHREYGGPHAEVNAIHSVADPALLPASTVYVNLEPCAHYGKTPPCADLLVSRQVKKVVIGMKDPFPKVDGAGVRRLREAGIDVELGLLEPECRELNRRFLCYHEKKRPYIVLKWMQSANGFIGKLGEKELLSNAFSLRRVHRWRTEEQAILIGPDTANNDNPSLNARYYPGNNPQRVLLDRNLRASGELTMFNDGNPLWIFNTRKEGQEGNIRYLQCPEEQFLREALNRLNEEGIASLMVEGGARIHEAFMEAGLWDECRIGVAQKALDTGVAAPPWPRGIMPDSDLEGDCWFEARNHP